MRKIGWNFQISVYHGGQHSCPLFNDPRKCFFFTSYHDTDWWRHWFMPWTRLLSHSCWTSLMLYFLPLLLQLDLRAAHKFTTSVVLTLRPIIWKIWILGDCDIFSIINNVEGTGNFQSATFIDKIFVHKRRSISLMGKIRKVLFDDPS